MHTRTITLATAAVLAAALTACSSDHDPAPKEASAAQVDQPATVEPVAVAPTVSLAWSHNATSWDEPQVWYVTRVKNTGASEASVAVDVRALDKTGTIVGSAQDTLPNIPAGATFDYFGTIGGSIGTELTGTPDKIEVSRAENAFGRAGSIEAPMLKTSEVKLTASADDTYTDAPNSYDLSAKVTNSTTDAVSSGVTQQVILYNAQGQVVGGESGFSDNIPQTLPTGMSYREQWTGIPAIGEATRAVYTVWVG
ncbi:hypothetical protein ACIRFH_36450 [Streptomyces sp. NPDC093586]|uniref:hypothetical protein n=1 Tax=Streptomyces sp. NPDC093586 TaxID=3366042 RepID=UPI00381C1780